jgi:uncharacterized flavoprotein (TIGR03862 family)
VKLAIVGGGPAGLRAAEVVLQADTKVTLFEGKRSVGRKFLIAGHGGLNLTHSEERDAFVTRYQGGLPQEVWTSLFDEFCNKDLRTWASDLGIETFIGTSGRVFPKEFKAAPLLRRWVERLRSLSITFKTCHYLKRIERLNDSFILEFNTPIGEEIIEAKAVILALGGASWPETGSDGGWVSLLGNNAISITPLSPANCGWETSWHPDILSQAEGLPLKNISVTAEGKTIPGELLITRYGLEGGSLYQLGSTLRRMNNPRIILDLKPSFSIEELTAKIPPGYRDLLATSAKEWRLHPAALALLQHLAPEDAFLSPGSLAKSAKALVIPLLGPRPIAEAISSAGGVSFLELDDNLMVKRLPGLFVAGEMIDWEAPTGGYLLQGCFSTGTRAAKGALQFTHEFL